MSTFERLQTIISDVIGIGPEQVMLSSSLEDDLGMDSLDAIEILMGAEIEFDIEFDEGDLEAVKTVGDALLLVDRGVSA